MRLISEMVGEVFPTFETLSRKRTHLSELHLLIAAERILSRLISSGVVGNSFMHKLNWFLSSCLRVLWGDQPYTLLRIF